MKILVFSDSHHSTSQMIAAIHHHNPHTVLHLGDLMSDTRCIRELFPQLPLVCVPGNCDGWTDVPNQKLITIEGKKILLSHGHIWQVKQGYQSALLHGLQAGADILLFGHTHVPYCETHDSMWVMNPGASSQCYGIIEINGDHVHCQLHLSNH